MGLDWKAWWIAAESYLLQFGRWIGAEDSGVLFRQQMMGLDQDRTGEVSACLCNVLRGQDEGPGEWEGTIKGAASQEGLQPSTRSSGTSSEWHVL